MKGYKYYYKKKNIKLRIFFIIALSGVILYFIIKNVSILPLFQSHKIDYNSIKDLMNKYDTEKDRMEKRVIINKITKIINKALRGKEDVYDGTMLYLLGSINLRRALLEYNKELRNMYLDKAIFYYRKSLVFIKENANLAFIHFELGKSYFYKGEYYYYESLLELEKAKQLGYTHEILDKMMAFIKFKVGDSNELNELINNFKTSKEGSIENYFYDAYLYKNNQDYNKSAEHFLYIINYFSSHSLKTEEEKYIYYKSLYSLGWLHYNKKDFKSALSYYQEALKYDEKDPDLYYWMGKVYEEMKNIREAKKMWETALRVQPNYEAAKQKLKKIKTR